MSHYIEIDGSVLEGGGQILRMSVAFSAVLGKPVRVKNIRANRSKPGLAAQHQQGIELVAKMCQAHTKGVAVGSTEIEFNPARIQGGYYTADTKTAGSISLLMQIALPVAFFALKRVTLELKGGTNAEMAPQVDYMTEVARPVMEKFGATFDFDLHRRGYYPRGGGHVTLTINPVRELRGVVMTDAGRVGSVTGWSYVAGSLPITMAYDMCEAAIDELSTVCENIDIDCYKESPEMAPDDCSGILLVSHTSTACVLGADALVGRGREPVTAGREAGRTLYRHLRNNVCLDDHAQDQVIILMALAEGRSSFLVGEITLHTKTAMHVASTIAKVKFTVTPHKPGTNIIECTGVGFYNERMPMLPVRASSHRDPTRYEDPGRGQ